MSEQGKGTFTGRHMLAIMLAFFGTIIVVNMLMLTLASRSWTGLVVKSSYVAGQQFNSKAAAGRIQEALGLTGNLTIADGTIRYGLVDAQGVTVRTDAVTMAFRRPTYESEDWSATLEPVGNGIFAVSQTPKDGVWIIDIKADIGRETPYRDVKRVEIDNGTFR